MTTIIVYRVFMVLRTVLLVVPRTGFTNSI
jgi:hypothetical protein